MKIAITGKMCSGKSTIANMITQIDNSFIKIAFADKIKELAIDLFNMETKDRDLLINIGTKFREIDRDVWINYVIKKTSDNKNYILDDLRFQNELDILVKHGWIIIDLDVLYVDQISRIKKLYPNNYENHIKNMNHISEQKKLDYKYNGPILQFNTSKDEFYKIKHNLVLLLNKK